MKNFISEPLHRSKILSLVVIAGTLLYVLMRALTLSFTHDEALSLLIHAQASFLQLFRFDLPLASNANLNTILMKPIQYLLGYSEIVLRIPALVGFGFYLTGILKLLKNTRRGIFFIFALALMLWHPFLIDYFSCARGYSLALGFFIWGIHLLLIRHQDPRLKYSVLSAMMFTLAVASHLSFWPVSFSGHLCLLFLEVKSKRDACNDKSRPFYEKIFLLMLSLIFSFLLTLIPTLQMAARDELYVGGLQGLWGDTFKSLMNVSVYGNPIPNGLTQWLLILCALIFLLVLAAIITARIRNKNFTNSHLPLTYCTRIFILCILSLSISHQVLGFKYPVERTAIYFIPLFLLMLIYFQNWLISLKIKGIRVLSRSVFMMNILLVFHFMRCMNFTHFYSCTYDADTKTMMQDLKEIYSGKTLPQDSVRLGVTWLFEPSVNYYILKDNISWLKWVVRTGADDYFDYYYLTAEDSGIINKYGLKALNKYSTSKATLAKSIPAKKT